MSEPTKLPTTFVYRFWQGLVALGSPLFILLLLDLALHPFEASATPMSPAVRLLVGFLVAPLTVGLGALCVRRARGNVIGLMLIVMGYGTLANTIRASWITNLPVAMIGYFLVVFYWMAFLMIPSYFPTGQVYPPRLERWGNRFVGLVLVHISLMVFATQAFEVGGVPGSPAVSVDNPLFIPLLEPLGSGGLPLILILAGWGIATLFLRYRAGGARERLQIRLLLAGFVTLMVLTFLDDFLEGLNIGIQSVSEIIVPFASTLVHPLAVAVAILRYRLYDIDIIIRRTVVYSTISAILALVYFGGVALLQATFVALTGQESPLAVVASTLAIAALFTPVRRRVQDVVDRRFYRRKYDAERTVDQFARAVRDEVDIDRLRGTLLGVVEESMHPEHVSLWLRSGRTGG